MTLISTLNEKDEQGFRGTPVPSAPEERKWSPSPERFPTAPEIPPECYKARTLEEFQMCAYGATWGSMGGGGVPPMMGELEPMPMSPMYRTPGVPGPGLTGYGGGGGGSGIGGYTAERTALGKASFSFAPEVAPLMQDVLTPLRPALTEYGRFVGGAPLRIGEGGVGGGGGGSGLFTYDTLGNPVPYNGSFISPLTQVPGTGTTMPSSLGSGNDFGPILSDQFVNYQTALGRNGYIDLGGYGITQHPYSNQGAFGPSYMARPGSGGNYGFHIGNDQDWILTEGRNLMMEPEWGNAYPTDWAPDAGMARMHNVGVDPSDLREGIMYRPSKEALDQLRQTIDPTTPVDPLKVKNLQEIYDLSYEDAVLVSQAGARGESLSQEGGFDVRDQFTVGKAGPTISSVGMAAGIGAGAGMLSDFVLSEFLGGKPNYLRSGLSGGGAGAATTLMGLGGAAGLGAGAIIGGGIGAIYDAVTDLTGHAPDFYDRKPLDYKAGDFDDRFAYQEEGWWHNQDYYDAFGENNVFADTSAEGYATWNPLKHGAVVRDLNYGDIKNGEVYRGTGKAIQVADWDLGNALQQHLDNVYGGAHPFVVHGYDPEHMEDGQAGLEYESLYQLAEPINYMMSQTDPDAIDVVAPIFDRRYWNVGKADDAYFDFSTFMRDIPQMENAKEGTLERNVGGELKDLTKQWGWDQAYLELLNRQWEDYQQKQQEGGWKMLKEYQKSEDEWWESVDPGAYYRSGGVMRPDEVPTTTTTVPYLSPEEEWINPNPDEPIPLPLGLVRRGNR